MTSPNGHPFRVNNWKRRAFDKAADLLVENNPDLLRPDLFDYDVDAVGDELSRLRAPGVVG